MGKTTNIEWTDATWNPWVGCTKVSEGCTNCYAERGTTRFGRDFAKLRRTNDRTFYAPLRWKDPQKIFVCSYSDFFHEDAEEWRAGANHVMRLCPEHTFQILTKRPENIHLRNHGACVLKPYPNVQLGVTVEKQEQDWRIRELLKVPAAGRFLSLEPMLGPIDLKSHLGWQCACGECGIEDACQWRKKIQWVIVGGESGPNARPMHPDWVRSVRDQCKAAGVPFFFKQWGEWAPGSNFDEEQGIPSGEYCDFGEGLDENASVWRVGKKKAGRLLDGKAHAEFPNA